MTVVEVDIRQVTAAGGIDVPSVVTKVGAPDVAVLPAADRGVTREEVECRESTRRRNAERQVGAAALGDVRRNASCGEAHDLTCSLRARARAATKGTPTPIPWPKARPSTTTRQSNLVAH